MKEILTILLTVLTLSSFGQKCDTLKGMPINCIDSAGLKQGYWEITKKKILISGYSGLGSNDGCRYFEKAEYYALSKGNYKDGIKLGTWEYYSGDKLEIIQRRLTYFENGEIEEENLTENYSLKISSDTTQVEGQINHENDTIEIYCRDKVCVFNTQEGLQLMSFEFTDMDRLEYELLRLNMGLYDREIKKKKTHVNKK